MNHGQHHYFLSCPPGTDSLEGPLYELDSMDGTSYTLSNPLLVLGHSLSLRLFPDPENYPIERKAMICTRCGLKIHGGQTFFRTKRGPHHEICPWICHAKPARLKGLTCLHLNVLGGIMHDNLVCCSFCGSTKIASDLREAKEKDSSKKRGVRG